MFLYWAGDIGEVNAVVFSVHNKVSGTEIVGRS